MKARVLPGAMIVTVSGIEHSAFFMRANPSPWFGAAIVIARLQHHSIFVVVFDVFVGFIPSGKRQESLHDRMVVRADPRGEVTRPMFGELRAA